MSSGLIFEKATFISSESDADAILALIGSRYPDFNGKPILFSESMGRMTVAKDPAGLYLAILVDGESGLEAIKTIANELVAEATSQASVTLNWIR